MVILPLLFLFVSIFHRVGTKGIVLKSRDLICTFQGWGGNVCHPECDIKWTSIALLKEPFFETSWKWIWWEAFLVEALPHVWNHMGCTLFSMFLDWFSLGESYIKLLDLPNLPTNEISGRCVVQGNSGITY